MTAYQTAACAVEESRIKIEQRSNASVGDPVLNHPPLFLALEIATPDETRQMLGDTTLRQAKDRNDVLLAHGTVEQFRRKYRRGVQESNW